MGDENHRDAKVQEFLLEAARRSALCTHDINNIRAIVVGNYSLCRLGEHYPCRFSGSTDCELKQALKVAWARLKTKCAPRFQPKEKHFFH